MKFMDKKLETKTEEKQPEKKENKDWVKMKPAEIKQIVIDLAKKGETPAKIGLILRDQHGVAKAKLLGKKISQIITEEGIVIKSMKENVEGKITKLNTHSAKHKHDYSAKRSLTKKLWIVSKLTKEAAA